MFFYLFLAFSSRFSYFSIKFGKITCILNFLKVVYRNFGSKIREKHPKNDQKIGRHVLDGTWPIDRFDDVEFFKRETMKNFQSILKL